MLAKRIIPCLDIQDGQVAKGVCFDNLRIVGNPLELALYYNQNGADELVFYDIHASNNGNTPFIKLITAIASALTIPFMVGGGIRTVDDIYDCLRAGADKVSINSAALKTPEILTQGAYRYGAQCIVASIDVKKTTAGYQVFTNGGKVNTGLDAIEWARRCEALGAGELVINAIHCDGVQAGFDINLTQRISETVKIPVIASGGAGKMADFDALFRANAASGALAASVFHDKRIDIPQLKVFLSDGGHPIRGLMIPFNQLRLGNDGLIPCIVVDSKTETVLMLAYMNETAYNITMETSRMTYFSRSRQALWEKGLTSGHTQSMVSVHLDCDQDTLLFKVQQRGPACHTGKASCFFDTLNAEKPDELTTLEATLTHRKTYPVANSYTTYLFEQGLDKILKKLGEEATEVVIASKNNTRLDLLGEVADLMYHLMVLLQFKGLSFSDVLSTLAQRRTKAAEDTLV